MGKQKYLNLQKSNKSDTIPNFVPYKLLAQRIGDINIEDVYDVNPSLPYDLSDDEIGSGLYRNAVQYSKRLAQFYIAVNEHRDDKLKTFATMNHKSPTSLLFLVPIGGDEAPVAGTTFLISFLNVGKRIASSLENYLLFGANVKENGIIVRRYIMKLVSELKHGVESILSNCNWSTLWCGI